MLSKMFPLFLFFYRHHAVPHPPGACAKVSLGRGHICRSWSPLPDRHSSPGSGLASTPWLAP
uniref:Secreted protein n=1 Tax=Setaria italica TaxID=4555 RepID=K4ANJ5_SETIT